MGQRTKGVAIKEASRRVWRTSCGHDVFGRAAELAYYFLLALFPLLIFLASVIGFLPGAYDNLLETLARVAPRDAMTLIRETVADIVIHRNSGLLSLGLVGSLWAASSGVASLMDALNTAYGVTETRSFWRRRWIAIALTLAFALMVLNGSLLIMSAHLIGGWLLSRFEVSTATEVLTRIAGYLTGLALLLGGIALLYRFGADLKREKRRVAPGALFAAIGIVAGSLLFSLYLRVAPSASATYGALGGVVTLLLWLYLLGLVLLIGGEINSEVETS